MDFITDSCLVCAPPETRHTSIRFVLSHVLCRYILNELYLVGFHYQAFHQDALGCCLWNLGLQTCSNDLFELCNIFYEHSRPSLMMFLVVQILFSRTNNLPLWIVCAMAKSALLLATVLRTPSQMHAAQSCSTVIEHTPTHKTPFLFSWSASLYL